MKHCAMVLLTLALVGSTQAGIVEDFESYEYGELTAQTTSWVDLAASGNFQVVEWWGGKALHQGVAADSFLAYADQEMDASGDGYTMMWMQWSGNPYGNYSGVFLDVGDGSGSFPPSLTYRRRFYLDGNGTLETTYNPTLHGNGAYSMVWALETYFRLRRQGDGIQIWYSMSPITADNPGTLMLESSNPGGLYDGWCGLWAVGNTYYDDVVIMEGDYIPEPATLSLLGVGGLLTLYRRRRNA